MLRCSAQQQCSCFFSLRPVVSYTSSSSRTTFLLVQQPCRVACSSQARTQSFVSFRALLSTSSASSDPDTNHVLVSLSLPPLPIISYSYPYPSVRPPSTTSTTSTTPSSHPQSSPACACIRPVCTPYPRVPRLLLSCTCGKSSFALVVTFPRFLLARSVDSRAQPSPSSPPRTRSVPVNPVQPVDVCP